MLSKEAFEGNLELSPESVEDSQCRLENTEKNGCCSGVFKENKQFQPDSIHECSDREKSDISSVERRMIKTRNYTRIDCALASKEDFPSWRFYLRSIDKDQAFYIRLRYRDIEGGDVSSFLKRSFFAGHLAVFLGDLNPHFNGALVARADLFSSVWDKNYPFRKVPLIVPHSYFYGNFVRGGAALLNVSAFELLGLAGNIGGYLNGHLNLGEMVTGARCAISMGRYNFIAKIIGYEEGMSTPIYSVGAEYKGGDSRLSFEAASGRKHGLAYEMRARASSGASTVALIIVDKPACYNSPLGNVMGRRISEEALQRGAIAFMHIKISEAIENAAGIESYSKIFLDKYRSIKVFDNMIAWAAGCELILSFSHLRTSKVGEIPYPSFEMTDASEKCSKFSLAVRYEIWKEISSRLKAGYQSGTRGSGFIFEQGISVRVFRDRFRLYQSLAYSFPITQRPRFYYLTSYFPGNYPWRQISGKVLALSFSCMVRVGGLQLSAYVQANGFSRTEVGLQWLAKF